MGRRFFDLGTDEYIDGRWYLGEPIGQDGQEVDDVWKFSDGLPIDISERLRFPVARPGKALDIEFAGVGLTPVVTERVAAVFRRLAPKDVQLFSVDVIGESGPYFLLNVIRKIRCIDDEASLDVQFRTSPEFKERIGEYRSVIGLRIDKSKVGDARVFRTWGWLTPIIVDEEVKEALEAAGSSGGKFDEV
ncbi:hypothetical protein JGU66_28235 [Myxococcaceae bacterium JPH2]|nr:hypothetical protein [Myxococcaceae bacterium JPH2]